MIPKPAIEKAIEGGWKRWEHDNATIYFYEPNGCNGQPCWVIDHTYADPLHEDTRKGKKWHLRVSDIALDPTFWQALGKALGWRREWNGQYMNTRYNPQEPIMVEGWEYNAHRLYDLILTGGDTEKFWEEILK